jgi:hypothetical protein
VAARRFPVEAGHVLAFGRSLGSAGELPRCDGTEVVSGYAHARLAR